jgi:hypothetical protein
MDIEKLLKELGLKNTGRYDNHFYIIDIDNSNDYAKMYSLLDEKAINTEYSSFGTNKSNNTIKVTNYFEKDIDNVTFMMFLIADFENDAYYLKIREK